MSIDLNDPRARQMFLANMSEQPTTSQMQQPQAQGPDSLAEFTRLLGGDLSGSLTGGDKLLALSALMRSATRSGRRAGLTPQQVIGQLQQQKVAELQNRIQVEQLRRDQEQQRQRAMVVQAYTANMTPDQASRFQYLLTPEQQSEVAKQAYVNKELAAAGLQPGTPEFSEGQRRLTSQGRFVQEPDGSFSFAPGVNLSDLVGSARPAATPPTSRQGPELSATEFMRVVRSRSDPQTAVEWAARNNIVVRPATPQEARMLPSGTPIMLPDGTMGRVP